MLSEERRLNPGRLDAPRVWVVDPLDGTREFGEPERQGWAVHIALVVDGVPTVGAVALPARGLTLATDAPPRPPAPPRRGRPRLLVSRTRSTALATTLAAGLGAELVPMGSGRCEGDGGRARRGRRPMPGLTVVESQASGRPPIAFAACDALETFEDGKRG